MSDQIGTPVVPDQHRGITAAFGIDNAGNIAGHPFESIVLDQRRLVAAAIPPRC